MPKEIFPSSYRCDCGYQADFCENTIKEMRKSSMRRPQRLGADDGQHVVVFRDGEMTAMWCPTTRKNIPANTPSQDMPRKARQS